MWRDTRFRREQMKVSELKEYHTAYAEQAGRQQKALLTAAVRSKTAYKVMGAKWNGKGMYVRAR